MADFEKAYEKTLAKEGGYVLHQVKGDRGGMTYAGISRKNHPHWPGWVVIDRGQEPEAEPVRHFYLLNYWRPIRGDDIAKQEIAESLFDFAVNAGVRVASKLAQIVCGTTTDGVIGPKTLAALNELQVDYFRSRYFVAKVARYRDIVAKDRTQMKFLLGWLNRSLEGMT
jgi:lysozyme family protein